MAFCKEVHPIASINDVIRVWSSEKDNSLCRSTPDGGGPHWWLMRCSETSEPWFARRLFQLSLSHTMDLSRLSAGYYTCSHESYYTLWFYGTKNIMPHSEHVSADAALKPFLNQMCYSKWKLMTKWISQYYYTVEFAKPKELTTGSINECHLHH